MKGRRVTAMSTSDLNTDPLTPPPLPTVSEPEPPRRTGMLCPYCGHFSPSKKECDKCRGVFEPLSRQASQNGMGPWFIRDEANPFRPGCSYATMRMLVARKRIVPESILRGPSTRQFWTFAKNTPGIAHLLGECHACHKSALPEAASCPHCHASFAVEEDRQYLGLAEVRLIPGQTMPETMPRPARAPAAAPRPAHTEFDHGANAIPVAEEGDRTPEPVPTAYEPIRNPARPVRTSADLSETQIDDLLRRSGAAERAKRSTTVVVVLSLLALIAVACVIVAAVLILSQSAGNTTATTGPAATPSPAPVTTPAASPPAKTPGKSPGK
jgi:hypothetical protein